MKVTTDACIQGAWTPTLPHAKRVLDIGTGTGLLALMLAQRRPNIIVDAIELDSAAAGQARGNIAASAWADRINIMEGDVCSYPFKQKYDLIISNPPFFNNSLQSDKVSKNMARHTCTLSYHNLLKAINDNLAEDGYASVLLPLPEYNIWKGFLQADGWKEFNQLCVSHSPGATVKRVVSIFSKKQIAEKQSSMLIIKDDTGKYTPVFTALLAPYYLDL
jgi:tRNA1Val (adenine37-N6)-methyltransferase